MGDDELESLRNRLVAMGERARLEKDAAHRLAADASARDDAVWLIQTARERVWAEVGEDVSASSTPGPPRAEGPSVNQPEPGSLP